MDKKNLLMTKQHDPGYWLQDTRCWILDTGCWMLDKEPMAITTGSIIDFGCDSFRPIE
jgi:hypothetical protein